MNVSIHKNRATLLRSQELYFQRHDIEIQRRNVPEGGSFNIATLGSNVTTLKSNVVMFPSMLKSDVTTLKPTS